MCACAGGGGGPNRLQEGHGLGGHQGQRSPGGGGCPARCRPGKQSRSAVGGGGRGLSLGQMEPEVAETAQGVGGRDLWLCLGGRQRRSLGRVKTWEKLMQIWVVETTGRGSSPGRV